MPNALYKKYLQGQESSTQAGYAAAVNLASDTINVYMVGTGYTPNLASDEYLSDLGANVIGTAVQTTFTSNTNGTFKGSAVTLAVPASTTVKYLVLSKSTGTNSTSPLLAIIDGLTTVTCAVAASSGATSIQVDPLVAPIASGTAFAMGAVTVTLTAAAAVGGRFLTCSATSGSIAQGVSGTPAITGSNLPFATSTSSVNLTVTPDATAGWFSN